MQRNILINPTNLHAEPQHLVLTLSLLENGFPYVEKSVDYSHLDSPEFNFTHNLIRDQDNLTRYYVVSNDKNDYLGEGGTSKARKIIGYLDLDIQNSSAAYTSNEDKALRIKNTKTAQKDHLLAGTEYDPRIAMEDYAKSKPFNHLGMQEPIDIEKSYAGLGFFMKSYSVMNWHKNRDLDKEVETFFWRARPNTAMIVRSVILPVLIAYKIQIAAKGYVHRDIKAGNVRALINLNSSLINFIDIDMATKIGSMDNNFGSAGYIHPQACSGQIATQARDIFALGVLLMGCIQPALDPVTYCTTQCGAHTLNDIHLLSDELVCDLGCYDPDRILSADGTSYDLFQLMNESGVEPVQEREEIKSIFKQMTNSDIRKIPDIDTVINLFKSVQRKLDLQLQSFVKKTPSKA